MVLVFLFALPSSLSKSLSVSSSLLLNYKWKILDDIHKFNKRFELRRHMLKVVRSGKLMLKDL